MWDKKYLRYFVWKRVLLSQILRKNTKKCLFFKQFYHFWKSCSPVVPLHVWQIQYFCTVYSTTKIHQTLWHQNELICNFLTNSSQHMLYPPIHKWSMEELHICLHTSTLCKHWILSQKITYTTTSLNFADTYNVSWKTTTYHAPKHTSDTNTQPPNKSCSPKK